MLTQTCVESHSTVIHCMLYTIDIYETDDQTTTTTFRVGKYIISKIFTKMMAVHPT